MVEHSAKGFIFSSSLDVAVWGVCFLVVVVWLCYVLGLSIIRGGNLQLSNIGLFCVLGGLVVWVCLAFFGLVGLESLVLASGLLIFLCLLFSWNFFGVSRIVVFLRFLVGCIVVIFFFEVAALLLFNLPSVFNLDAASSSVALHWNLVELIFSNLSYPFLPTVYLLFVLFGVSGLVALVLPWQNLKDRLSSLLIRFWDRIVNFFVLKPDGDSELFQRRIVVYMAIFVGVVVSFLFVVFTVLPWANPTGMLVSVDSPSYYQWIVHMRGLDVNSALGFAINNDRALFLVLAYALSFVVSPVWVVQFASAFLTVAFGVVCFFVLRLLCQFREVWVYGVLMVPVSFQALGLIYSGYFANMLALILVFVYLLLFFRLLNSWSNVGFLALIFVSVGVLFSHSWTWFIFALSLLMFLLLEWRMNGRGALSGRFKSMIIFVGLTLGAGLSCDLIRKLVSPVSSTSSVLLTVGSSLGLPNFSYLSSGLQKSVDFVLGGVYANCLLVFLCFVGFLVLLGFKSGLARFFVAWIFVCCVSILFAADDLVFDRFLFLMPWVVLSALGLFWGLSFVSRFGDWGRSRFWVVLFFLAFIFLMLFNGALRFVFNINIW